MSKMSKRQLIERAIRALEGADGTIKASDLVEAARERSHPAHNEFTWDKTEAAYQYNLIEARKLINSVRINMVVGEQTVTTSAYVRDQRVVPEEGYRRIERVRDDTEVAYLSMKAEVDRAQAAVERGREIAAALGLYEEFIDAVRELSRLSGRIRRGGPASPPEDRMRP